LASSFFHEGLGLGLGLGTSGLGFGHGLGLGLGLGLERKVSLALTRPRLSPKTQATCFLYVYALLRHITFCHCLLRNVSQTCM